MKDDAPVPPRPPRKRRQLASVPDVWLATWDDDRYRPQLTPSERARVRYERAARKARGTYVNEVGLVVGAAGLTAEQLEALRETLPTIGATAIRHAGVARPVHAACRGLGVPLHVTITRGPARFEEHRDIIRRVNRVIAFLPRERDPANSEVGEHVRYARHRSVPVTVIDPDGRSI